VSSESQPSQGGPAVDGPPPPAAKPRLLQDGRDMFWSLAPLVVACIVLAAVLGMCSFAPGGPGAGPAPNFDAPAALRADADALRIPIRLPELPPGWRANSGSRAGIEGGRSIAAGQPTRAVSSTVGYLTPTGTYIALTQSNADEEKLVGFIDTDMVPTGTQDVDGTGWVVYEGDDGSEPVWTARLNSPSGPAQIAIKGAAGTDEYRTLAAAVQKQPPLAAT
jgi:hypothetical protein